MAPPKKAAGGPEGHLRTALQEIALAGSYPGADMEGLAHLQAQVTQMLHQVGQHAEGGAPDPGSAMQGIMGGGQPPGGPGAMPSPGGTMAPPGGAGLPGAPPSPSIPNPDELMKILGPAMKGGVQ